MRVIGLIWAIALSTQSLVCAQSESEIYTITEPMTLSEPTACSTPLIPFATMEARYTRHVQAVLQTRGPYECNSENVQIRKEWGAMSAADRINYTAAVNCLTALPAQSNPKDVPGARTRYDDFVAGHIMQAYNIHFTGTLFQWHRTLIWEYEQALRNECGYTGAQPYWDWPLYANDPRNSPLFDGSATSLGNNGVFIPHGNTTVEAFGLTLSLPPGTGGGNVTQGPFAYFTVNLGKTLPLSPPDGDNVEPYPSTSTDVNDSANTTDLDYNPRNLTRDINLFWSNQAHTSDVEFLLSCSDMDCFQKRVDGYEYDREIEDQPRLHGAGHFTLGGLANDPFASPGDPAFYFHHAQLDRIWSIWQAQDPDLRQYQVAGTITPFDIPPSRNTTLQDLMIFGVIGEDLHVQDAMDSINYKFCYIYE